MNQSVVKSEMQTVGAAFEKMKGQFKNALPAHITPDRMVRVAMTAMQNTPKLLQCDRNSLYMAVLKSAQLGLEPDGVLGQAYLLPYGNKVQLIVGYKGLIDLARRSGEVSNIIAKEVCVNDDFELAWHEEVPFRHKQDVTGNRGDIIGFWAMARFKDGGFHFDYMTVDEVNTIRDGSQGYQSAKRYAKNGVINSPWESNYAEMGKKTVIRRIAKYLPMSVQRASAVEDMIDAGKKFDVSETGDIVIEHEQDENVIDALNAEVEESQTSAPKQPEHDEDGVIIEPEAKPDPKEEKPSITLESIDVIEKMHTIAGRVKMANTIVEGINEGVFSAAEATARMQEKRGLSFTELVQSLTNDGRGNVADKLVDAAESTQ